MGFLKISRADLGRRNLCSNGEHRQPRFVAIEKAVDQMQIPRPTAPGADSELTRQVRFGARRESGDFFVPDVHPLDLALAAKRVGKPVQAVANDAVYPLDTRCYERL